MLGRHRRPRSPPAPPAPPARSPPAPPARSPPAPPPPAPPVNTTAPQTDSVMYNKISRLPCLPCTPSFPRSPCPSVSACLALGLLVFPSFSLVFPSFSLAPSVPPLRPLSGLSREVYFGERSILAGTRGWTSSCSTSTCKINGHFSIENHRFSGAILHSFCVFTRKFQNMLAYIYCNSQYKSASCWVRVYPQCCRL